MADVSGCRMAVNRSAPDRRARLPVRHDTGRADLAVMKPYLDHAILALDGQSYFLVAQPHRPLALARHGLAAQLSRYAPLALAEHVVDGSGDSRKHFCRFALRRGRMKAAWKFLGDEASRKLPRLPARMRHQRGEKLHIVTDAVDHEGIECIALGGDRRRARRRMRHELGDHRVVVE